MMELTEVQNTATTTSTRSKQDSLGNGDGLFHSSRTITDENGQNENTPLDDITPTWRTKTFWALTVWILVSTISYLLLFTRMGFGLHIYSRIIAQYLEPWAGTMTMALAFYWFTLYLFLNLADIYNIFDSSDDSYSNTNTNDENRNRKHLVLWKTLLTTGCLGLALLVISLAGDYPYGPIALFTVATSVWMLLVWKFTTKQVTHATASINTVPARRFIGWCSGPFLLVSVGVLAAWLGWTLVFKSTGNGGRGWNSDELFHVVAEAQAAACDPNFDTYPQCQSSGDYDTNASIGDGVCFSLDYDTSSFVFSDSGDCDESCATNVYEDCLNPFILWVGPFLVSLCLLFLSFMAAFLSRTSVISSTTNASTSDEKEQPTTSQQQLQPEEEVATAKVQTNSTSFAIMDTAQKDEMVRFSKLWIVLLFGMWVAASLAGAGKGLSTALTAMTLAAFVASAIFVAVSFNAMERKHHIHGLKATVEAHERDNGNVYDAGKGLLLLTCTPIAILYLAIAFVKQGIRRNLCRSKNDANTHALADNQNNDDDELEHDGWFTVEAQRLIDWVRLWDRRARVFTYAVYWGIAFVVLNVIIAQFTLLFLSWLIGQTSTMPLGAVTAILMGVGVCMFLLPPVPGVPIYLTLGIAIIPVGRETLGIAGSIGYALVVSTILKLLACTLQQKIIGGQLQHHVGVRQFVGVNSKVIRSMKLILAEPGLSVSKCVCLIGCPDWPTSVLCGILDLSLIPILVGTLPIVFLILPTLLTGCFTYMGGLQVSSEYGQEDEFPWADTVATVCAALTGLVQFGSMVLAAYYVEQTVSKRGDEVEAIPIDKEVEAANAKLEDAKRAYEEVTEWDMVPFWAKGVLSASLACIVMSCYLLQSMSEYCFAEFQLTYTIDEHLNGDWTSLVLPLGLVAIGLFLVSVVLLKIFISWAKKGASQKVAVSAEGTPYSTLS